MFFTLLVEFSIRQETVNYGTLIELSKNRYSKNLFVYVGVPTTTGRRLNCLREHTDRLKLPDISSLVVSEGLNVSGDAYHLDAKKSEKERAKVYKTHWVDYYCQILTSLEDTRNELKLS